MRGAHYLLSDIDWRRRLPAALVEHAAREVREMFLLVRHVLGSRLADVVLPRDTARTFERRYL